MEAMMTIRQTMRKVSQNLPTSVACCDAFSSHRSTKCQDIQIQNWLREDAARFDEHANWIEIIKCMNTVQKMIHQWKLKWRVSLQSALRGVLIVHAWCKLLYQNRMGPCIYIYIYITIDPCILRLIPSNILYINKHIIHTIPATLKLYRYSLPTNPIQAYKPI